MHPGERGGQTEEHIASPKERLRQVQGKIYAVSALSALAENREWNPYKGWMEKVTEVAHAAEQAFEAGKNDASARRMFRTILHCNDSELDERFDRAVKNVLLAGKRDSAADYEAAAQFVADVSAYLIVDSWAD